MRASILVRVALLGLPLAAAIAFVSSNSGGPTGFRAELDLTAN